jgi:hypothetical protein
MGCSAISFRFPPLFMVSHFLTRRFEGEASSRILTYTRSELFRFCWLLGDRDRGWDSSLASRSRAISACHTRPYPSRSSAAGGTFRSPPGASSGRLPCGVAALHRSGRFRPNTMAMAHSPDATFVLYPELTSVQQRTFPFLDARARSYPIGDRHFRQFGSRINGLRPSEGPLPSKLSTVLLLLPSNGHPAGFMRLGNRV